MMVKKGLKLAVLVLPVLAACGGGGDGVAVADGGKTSAMALKLPAGTASPEQGGVLMSGGSATTTAAADASASGNANVNGASASGNATAGGGGGAGSLLAGFLAGLMPNGGNAGQLLDPSAAANTAVPKPESCAEGDNPEKGQQGQTSVAERFNGANKVARNCNLQLVGQYQGEGTTWYSTAYMEKDKGVDAQGRDLNKGCKYFGTASAGINFKKSQGVQVVDATDPHNPKLATNLASPAFYRGTWETLKVNEKRKLLAGVGVNFGYDSLAFDVYDISEDCTKPKLLNSFLGSSRVSKPSNVLGHEGNWAPDGLTYYSTGLFTGSLNAIDVSDPKAPKSIYVGTSGISNHGFNLSEDGNRLYLSMAFPAGILILDTSDIQARKPVPVIRQVGSLFWNALGLGQMTIPVKYGSKPYLIAVDELAAEGVRIIDISDETKPKTVSHIQLEAMLPKNAKTRRDEINGNGWFGYEAHYCRADNQVNPTALACGFLQSGIRVFDIRDPAKPREIAYYNPASQMDLPREKLAGSEHAWGLIGGAPTNLSEAGNKDLSTILRTTAVRSNLTTDFCSSSGFFMGPSKKTGRQQLWVTCQDNGALFLEFTNNAYPLAGSTQGAGQ